MPATKRSVCYILCECPLMNTGFEYRITVKDIPLEIHVEDILFLIRCRVEEKSAFNTNYLNKLVALN